MRGNNRPIPTRKVKALTYVREQQESRLAESTVKENRENGGDDDNKDPEKDKGKDKDKDKNNDKNNKDKDKQKPLDKHDKDEQKIPLQSPSLGKLTLSYSVGKVDNVDDNGNEQFARTSRSEGSSRSNRRQRDLTDYSHEPISLWNVFPGKNDKYDRSNSQVSYYMNRTQARARSARRLKSEDEPTHYTRSLAHNNYAQTSRRPSTSTAITQPGTILYTAANHPLHGHGDYSGSINLGIAQAANIVNARQSNESKVPLPDLGLMHTSNSQRFTASTPQTLAVQLAFHQDRLPAYLQPIEPLFPDPKKYPGHSSKHRVNHGYL